VTATPFLFFSGGVPLAGRLHRTGSGRQPAVVVAGSWLTVKEQMADRYAAALADRGFTALTFDFAGFGASGGEPRQVESPTRKQADLAAAGAAVRSLALTDPGPPALLAVCASAQYALAADLDVSALAAVAGWFHDLDSVTGLYGGPDAVAGKLRRSDAALETYQRTGEVVTVPAYDPGDPDAGMAFPLDYYARPERGAVPAWRNEMAEMSWRGWLTFDGLSPRATAPVLLVHSDDAVLPDNARAVAKATDAAVVWTTGEQTDFYDLRPQVTAAADAAAEHFRDAR
jgi:uncharacterized protein